MTIHSTPDEKEEQRRKLAADIAEFAARGGVTQAITPEQYRQHNIEREANRSVTRNMLTLETVMDTTTWDTMEDTRDARFALLSATSGDYSMVDGNDVHMHGDGPLRSRAERDFFKDYDETEIEELIDDDHDYDEWQ
jgi:hypothetical protein